MRFPIDVASRVSPQLSALIEKLVNDPDREEPPTLENVRTVLEGDQSVVSEVMMHPQDRTSAASEVEDLIAEFGGDVLAVDFVTVTASEGLSRIIETAMSDETPPGNPTLGGVRKAMVNGLTERLVGYGSIDPDADQTLLAEIDALIERFGQDTLAEEFVRLE